MSKDKKIAVETIIKRCTKKKGCFSLGIGDVKISEDQRNRFDEMIDDAEAVRLTIEPLQEKLLGM